MSYDRAMIYDMTAIAKALLRSKFRFSDKDRLKISENRKQYHLGAVGVKKWWKGNDLCTYYAPRSWVTGPTE